jgi:hypothetical protein
MPASKFQIKLSDQWRDYSNDEDKILKRAFMAGYPGCKFHLRRQEYQYDFKRMVQRNAATGKERQIRPPNKWKQPSAPIVPEGKTTVVNVPKDSPGKVILVPYPGIPGKFINVNVPAKARPGQAMLVPVPPIDQAVSASAPAAAAAPAEEKKGWSTGAKVAGGTAAVVGVAGAAVGGAILGEHIAEHGLDATVDAVGDGLADAGEAIGDAAVDAGEFIVDGAEEVGDFIMDLF